MSRYPDNEYFPAPHQSRRQKSAQSSQEPNHACNISSDNMNMKGRQSFSNNPFTGMAANNPPPLRPPFQTGPAGMNQRPPIPTHPNHNSQELNHTHDIPPNNMNIRGRQSFSNNPFTDMSGNHPPPPRLPFQGGPAGINRRPPTPTDPNQNSPEPNLTHDIPPNNMNIRGRQSFSNNPFTGRAGNHPPPRPPFQGGSLGMDQYQHTPADPNQESQEPNHTHDIPPNNINIRGQQYFSNNPFTGGAGNHPPPRPPFQGGSIGMDQYQHKPPDPNKDSQEPNHTHDIPSNNMNIRGRQSFTGMAANHPPPPRPPFQGGPAGMNQYQHTHPRPNPNSHPTHGRLGQGFGRMPSEGMLQSRPPVPFNPQIPPRGPSVFDGHPPPNHPSQSKPQNDQVRFPLPSGHHTAARTPMIQPQSNSFPPFLHPPPPLDQHLNQRLKPPSDPHNFNQNKQNQVPTPPQNMSPFPVPQAMNSIQSSNFGSSLDTGYPRMNMDVPTGNDCQDFETGESDMPSLDVEKGTAVCGMMPKPDDDVAKLDAEWINSFLSSHAGKSENLRSYKKSTLTIPAAQSLIKEAITLRNSLQCLLNKTSDIPGSTHSVKETDLIKKRLEEIKRILNKDEIDGLKIKIQRLKSKRARKRRQKQSENRQQQENEKHRKELHEKIDAWHAGLAQKAHEKKKNLELKKAADQILAEVRHKQTDISRASDLLIAFSNLRRVRKEKAENRGEVIPASSDHTYQEHLVRINSLLDRQMETYKEEQRVLEVMMEVENKETENKEKEILWSKEKKKLKGLKRILHEYLFGEEKMIKKSDPIYAHRQYYQSAEQSLEELMAIRHQWDMYVIAPGTPGASHLPADWVQPVAPSSFVWASALRDPDQCQIASKLTTIHMNMPQS